MGNKPWPLSLMVCLVASKLPANAPYSLFSTVPFFSLPVLYKPPPVFSFSYPLSLAHLKLLTSLDLVTVTETTFSKEEGSTLPLHSPSQSSPAPALHWPSYSLRKKASFPSYPMQEGNGKEFDFESGDGDEYWDQLCALCLGKRFEAG